MFGRRFVLKAERSAPGELYGAEERDIGMSVRRVLTRGFALARLCRLSRKSFAGLS